MTAEEFIETLGIVSQDYTGNIPMREIFALAKEYRAIPVKEVLLLLKSENYTHRIGAVSILDWKARDKKISDKDRKEVYYAYMDHHEFIDDWGLVDRAAPYVVGGYLFDKDRTPLYILANSDKPMERRTAIVSTYYFIRKDDIEDTFKIAEILIDDTNESVQKAVGSWVREAGKRNEEKLKGFLNKYAGTMPRIMLRYAIEKLDKETRAFYLNLKKS